MTNPLHAAHFADEASHVRTDIVENVLIAKNTYRLRFRAPEMAARFRPGQFLMMRIAGLQDPLIGRALAMYDVVLDSTGRGEYIDVVYVAKGKFTSLAAELSEGQVEVWGPLGNGFSIPEIDRLILVAGGIGQTPFLSVIKQAKGRQTFGNPASPAPRIPEVLMCYGARSADYFAGLDDFQAAGAELRLATDDGSMGHPGLVTEVLRAALEEQQEDVRSLILCCGPEPMMEAASQVAAEFQTPCQVSLETPMACGVGICFTCVAKVKDDDGCWDYKRTCVEGPVFASSQIEW